MEQATTIKVFCDGATDLELFRRLADLSSLLKQIPTENISVYPQRRSALRQSQYTNIIPLI